MLNVNTTLTTLSLEDNNCGEKEIIKIIGSLKKNNTLTSLNLCGIEEQTRQDIQTNNLNDQGRQLEGKQLIISRIY